MDANGSRFQMLLTHDDWGRCTLNGVALADLWHASPPVDARAPVAWSDRNDELTLRVRLFRFVAGKGDIAARIDQRRGSAADRFGNVYWIDASSRAIRVQSVGSGRASQFWPADDRRAEAFRGDFVQVSEVLPKRDAALGGLAVTDDHYLVVGSVDPPGLLVFDLFAGGPPTRLAWPNHVAFEPFDIAARPGGGVWILDRTHRCYWALDRHLRVLRDEQASVTLREAREESFQALDTATPRASAKMTFPSGIEYDAASPLDAIDAIAIEALPDGSVLILDRDEAAGFSRVWRYRFKRSLGEPVSLDSVASMIESDQRAGFKLVAHDFVYLPADAAANEPAQLVVASSEGNQAFAMSLRTSGEQLELEPLARYLPMRRFGGAGLLRSGSRAFYDFADGWLPLVQQHRPRYELRASLDTRAHQSADVRANDFDSGDPDCVWHRLMLDACIPPETGVEVWSRAANDRDSLLASEWRREPTLYRRAAGSELPWPPARPACTTTASTQFDYGTWELLFQQAIGRYLQLRLVITGNERATPRLRALRVWLPRFSYVEHYLPDVYQEEAQSASFLDRYLANLEGFCTTLEDRIANVQMLFDWRSVPADALAWLASWFDVALDPAWDERRRRLFIRHAMRFFQYRGTIHGIRMALALALDRCVDDRVFDVPSSVPETRQRFRIVERYLTRRTPGAVLGDAQSSGSPRVVETGARWSPTEGGAGLAARYAEYLSSTGKPGAPAKFDVIRPAGGDEARRWNAFAADVLGFVPSVADDRAGWQRFLESSYGSATALNGAHAAAYPSFDAVALPRDRLATAAARKDWHDYLELRQPAATVYERQLWQAFLARRYRNVAALNAVYRTNWTDFSEIAQPDVLPADGAPLADWYQFGATVLSMQRLAHRFGVLVPTPGPTSDLARLQEQLRLARRVVELEKPAHTVFDVGFYWALFRVGSARLGYDSLVDAGSRAAALVLDKAFVGESYLAYPPGHPGRERLTLECIPVTA